MDTQSQADWAVVEELLPEGWEEQAKALGAWHFGRKLSGPGEMLRLLLVHGGVGLSWQSTADVASLGGGAQVSKVALFKSCQRAAPLLEWLVRALLERQTEAVEVRGYRLLAVDGSWMAAHGGKVEVRVDWMVNLASLRLEGIGTATRRQGESLTRCEVAAGDLLVADRGFGRAGELAEVVGRGAEVLVRWGRGSTVPVEADGSRLEVGAWLAGSPAEVGEAMERPAWLPYAGGQLAGRLCAVRLSPEAAGRARRKAWRAGGKKGCQPEAATLAWAEWVVVFTTAAAERLSAPQVLAIYRARWQVELAFKRLKSLLKGDRLRTFGLAAARRWLLLKMVYALLLQAYLARAAAFSPSGRRRGSALRAGRLGGHDDPGGGLGRGPGGPAAGDPVAPLEGGLAASGRAGRGPQDGPGIASAGLAVPGGL